MTVIPAYNEESTIEQVVTGALKHSDVCVVDDASKDKTPAILAKLKKKFPKKLYVIRHSKNTHIPGGIQDGMRFALEKKYDWVVTMDAGMSHDPAMLPEFFNHPFCDLLIGTREKVEGVPFYRKVVSFLAARVMNYCISKSILDITGPGIRDCTSGFRRYSPASFSLIAGKKLESVSFDFHMEALYLVYTNGGKVEEIGIHYKFSNSSFNKKVFRQATQFAFTLLKRKFGL
ncbi:MAG: glycosyltransferase family 2 protein [Leptospira sp.]|nr:glycosyltransferase family 2 protein [Leptospira sp.]